MKRSGSRRRVEVSADGKGVVSHAGAALLRELAAETSLTDGVTGELLDTCRGFLVHLPGQCSLTWRWRSRTGRVR